MLHQSSAQPFFRMAFSRRCPNQTCLLTVKTPRRIFLARFFQRMKLYHSRLARFPIYLFKKIHVAFCCYDDLSIRLKQSDASNILLIIATKMHVSRIPGWSSQPEQQNKLTRRTLQHLRPKTALFFRPLSAAIGRRNRPMADVRRVSWLKRNREKWSNLTGRFWIEITS